MVTKKSAKKSPSAAAVSRKILRTERIPIDHNGHPDESGKTLEAGVCAAFWAIRNKIQDFAILVTPAQAESLAKAAAHMEQEPHIKVEKVPSGLVVRMVDQHGSTFQQAESNLEDQEKKERTQKLRRLLDSIPTLCEQSQQMDAGNISSTSVNQEMRDALQALRRELM